MNFDKISLTLAVFIPLVGMIGVLLVPKKNEQLAKIIALVSSGATLAVGIAILSRYNIGTKELQFTQNKSWIPLINARYEIGLDGIGGPMLLLSMLITFTVIIYSWNNFPKPHTPKAFLAMTLLLEIGMNGTFIAQDLILFFIFFEIFIRISFNVVRFLGIIFQRWKNLFNYRINSYGTKCKRLRFSFINWSNNIRRPIFRICYQGTNVSISHLVARRSY